MRILLTDCSTRKAFDTYNILCLHFESSDIILATDCWTQWQSRLVYKNPRFVLRKNSEDVFREDLFLISQLFSKESIVYLPLEEDSTTMFYAFIRRCGPLNFLFSLPPEESFNLVKDKYQLNKYCLQVDIPAPALFENDRIEHSNGNNFIPLIVKPRNGSGSKGIKYIDNISQLSSLNTLSLQNYVIQEKINGGKDVKGAFFLFNKGSVVSSYCHERIRTFPISGGVTVFSKISLNEEITKVGIKLLEKLNWSGFAMIEFLWDQKQNAYKVIEINPRLWGSIMLSEFAGTNFIFNYINLCINKPLTGIRINPDAKIRWLPFEFFNLICAKGKINNFWKIDKKSTCYINCTYASFWSVIWFHITFYFSIKNFQTLLLKWKK